MMQSTESIVIRSDQLSEPVSMWTRTGAPKSRGLIEYCEPLSGMPSLQRCELLAKSQVLKKQIAPSAEYAPNRSEQKPKQVDHVMLLSHLSCGREGCILLKSQQNRIMTRDRMVVLMKYTPFSRESSSTIGPCCTPGPK